MPQKLLEEKRLTQEDLFDNDLSSPSKAPIRRTAVRVRGNIAADSGSLAGKRQVVGVLRGGRSQWLFQAQSQVFAAAAARREDFKHGQFGQPGASSTIAPALLPRATCTGFRTAYKF
jgi:hypothetical protein